MKRITNTYRFHNFWVSKSMCSGLPKCLPATQSPGLHCQHLRSSHGVASTQEAQTRSSEQLSSATGSFRRGLGSASCTSTLEYEVILTNCIIKCVCTEPVWSVCARTRVEVRGHLCGINSHLPLLYGVLGIKLRLLGWYSKHLYCHPACLNIEFFNSLIQNSLLWVFCNS